MQKTSVIGTGSWGSALAKSFRANEHIAGRSAGQQIDADYVVIAVEAQKFRGVITKHKFAATSKIIICCKGIEQGSLKLMSEVLEEVLPNKFAILSGPNFADEIAAGLPSATSISSKDPELAKEIIKKFGKPNFRMYPMPDIIASQIGGALKNVIAIASGICAGKNLGENARAAVITRGIAEIAKLTRAKGGDERNLMGLCGFGDLMLTATSIKSRNYRFGVGIGSGAEEAKTGVIEGYYSAKSVCELAKKLNIEMPICFSVYEILYNNKNIDEAINDLLERPQG